MNLIEMASPIPYRPPVVAGSSEVRYSFSGHESFPFRYTWLPKSVRAVAEYPDLFVREDAPVILGVGKNMVRSIRHWSLTLGLIELQDRLGATRVSDLGRSLLGEGGWDPYLEDSGTLWLLHWLLVRKPDRASTWYLTFSRWASNFFTREGLLHWLQEVAAESPSTRATASSLRRDIDVFVRTYVPREPSRLLPPEETFDCPLAELGLIDEVEREVFHLTTETRPSLPPYIFLFAIVDYWDRVAPEQNTMSFERIHRGYGSPGAVFRISENALAERLENLPIWTGIRFDETAGMRVLLRTRDDTHMISMVEPLSVLAEYYRLASEGV